MCKINTICIKRKERYFISIVKSMKFTKKVVFIIMTIFVGLSMVSSLANINALENESIVNGKVTEQDIQEVMDSLFPDENLQKLLMDQTGNDKTNFYQKIIDEYEGDAVLQEEMPDVKEYIKFYLLGSEENSYHGRINDDLFVPANSGIESFEGVQNLTELTQLYIYDSQVDDKLAPFFEMENIDYVVLDYENDTNYNNEYYGNLARHDDWLEKVKERLDYAIENRDDESGIINFSTFVFFDYPALDLNEEGHSNDFGNKKVSINQYNYDYFEVDYNDYLTMPYVYTPIMHESTFFGWATL